MGVRFRFGKLRRNKYYLLIAVVLVVAAGSVATKALFLGGSGSVSSTGDIELQRGLVGHWKLDGNAKDSTPYGNNGTVFNSPAVASDRAGNTSGAYSFNGSNQYISIPDQNYFSPNVDGAMTISLWAMVPTSAPSQGNGGCGSSGRYMITKAASSQWEWGLENDSNNLLCFSVWNFGGSGIVTLTNSRTINDGQWHLYTAVLTASSSALYVDGASVATGGGYGAAGNGTQAVNIGRRGDGFYFYGSIDDTRIYSRALSAGEVSALYNEYDPGIKLLQSDSGLVGHWKLDGNAKDSSPYARNGTINGATPATDRKGTTNGAMVFNGTNNYIGLPDIDIPNTITVSAWANPTVGNQNSKILGKHSGASDVQGTLGVSSGRGFFEITVGGTYKSLLTPSALPTGSWSLLTGSYNGSTVSLYLNGVLVGSVAGSGAIANNNYGWAIGRLNSTISSAYFNGSIDDVRIYNRALSASEVANIYNSYDSAIGVGGAPGAAGSGVQLNSGLVGDWEFNGNARDSTPYGNNGTVNGATLTANRFGTANSAYNFNGTSGNIGITSSNFNLTDNFSVAAWVYANPDSNTNYSIVASAAWTMNGRDWWFHRRRSGLTNQLSFQVLNGSQITSSGLIAAGNWYHVVFTLSTGTARLYINGSLDTTLPGFGSIVSGNAGLLIGKQGGGQLFNGSIDNVRIYNRALSAAEVTALYNLND